MIQNLNLQDNQNVEFAQVVVFMDNAKKKKIEEE